MKTILTAEESFTKSTGCIINHSDVKKAMIEFAKLHVEAALKEASEKSRIKANTQQGNSMFIDDFEVNKESILNAYPLNNIK